MTLPARLVVDVDSTIVEVTGKNEDAAYGYTKKLGYDPLLGREPTPERSCMPGCARARPTPSAARSASSRS
jgi:hypothetical protein